MLVGLVVGGLGALGLASIAGGNPAPGAGSDAISGAGGFLGAVVGWPLSRAVATTGRSWWPRPRCPRGARVHRHADASVGRGLRSMVLGRPAADAAEPDGRRAAARRRSRGDDARCSRRAAADRAADAAARAEPVIIAEAKQIRLPLTVARGRLPAAPARPAPTRARPARPTRGTRNTPRPRWSARSRTSASPARVVAAHRGPTVTMYEVEVEAGTKVNRGPVAAATTSRTRSRRPTCGSSRPSPASRRSGSRCRTRSVTS